MRLIGKGFYSKVYLGCYKDSEKQTVNHNDSKMSNNSKRLQTSNEKNYVAIKSISKKKIIQKNSSEYILNEKNILSIIDCENVAKLICTAQNDKKVFFILEYYQNGDLFNYLNQLKFLEEEAVKFIMIQVYETLKYLHSKKIIYRDLKPENIMISDDGFIKLIDFGLAKQLNSQDEKLQEICGTNEYIPPEVASRQRYSFNFDWWGFGILMFELLVGKVYLFNLYYYLIF